MAGAFLDQVDNVEAMKDRQVASHLKILCKLAQELRGHQN
jgi:hypothetical protein